MHLDPQFQELSLVLLLLFVFGTLTKFLKVPNAVGFLIAGVLIGPSGLGLVTKSSFIHQVGSAGVVLLLFFVGLEISPKEVVKEWKITILGTTLQVVLSVLCVFLTGLYFGWPLTRSILMGFVISLSSSAMVIKLLKDKGMAKTTIGRDSLGILVAQDILVVPMLIIMGMLGDNALDSVQLFKQLVGAAFLGLLILTSYRFKFFHSKFLKFIKEDHEITLLFCLAFAFGLALISGMAELSTALGAFVAGGIIGQLKLGELFHSSLEPFQVVMTAIFFSSIGLLLDLSFFQQHYVAILVLTGFALMTNTVINAVVLRLLGRRWSESLIASSYLSQIGEFSFILASIGLHGAIISDYGYQLTIFIIFFSIVLTPFWIGIFELGVKFFSNRNSRIQI